MEKIQIFSFQETTNQYLLHDSQTIGCKETISLERISNGSGN